MSLQLYEATSDSEFDEIMDCKYTSYETPHNGFFMIFCPIHGVGPSAREDAIRESQERHLQWHNADPTSHWLKVVDTDIGMVIGAAQWHIYESDPFANSSPKPISAYWWPEGEGRAYAEAALEQWLAPRAETMRRPHLRTWMEIETRCGCFN